MVRPRMRAITWGELAPRYCLRISVSLAVQGPVLLTCGGNRLFAMRSTPSTGRFSWRAMTASSRRPYSSRRRACSVRDHRPRLVFLDAPVFVVCTRCGSRASLAEQGQCRGSEVVGMLVFGVVWGGGGPGTGVGGTRSWIGTPRLPSRQRARFPPSAEWAVCRPGSELPVGLASGATPAVPVLWTGIRYSPCGDADGGRPRLRAGMAATGAGTPRRGRDRVAAVARHGVPGDG